MDSVRPAVLCLDDRITELCAHLTALKEVLDINVYIAQTPQEASVIANEHRIDLFIMDIELERQDGSGIRFAQQLQLTDCYRQTPVLFISMYSHYSRYLLHTIAHSSFLSKPFSPEALIAKVGMILGIGGYAEKAYAQATLTIPTARGGFVEIDSARVSCIELIRSELVVHYTDGQTMTLKSSHGCFKALLDEIRTQNVSHLRQIYRSVIINVHQIKKLNMSKNSGEVLLFYDDVPKPVGNRYRDRLAEFL